jgi:hypothetical protein
MGCDYFEHLNHLTELIHTCKTEQKLHGICFIYIRSKTNRTNNRQVALLAGVGPYTKLSKAFLCTALACG